MNESLSLWKVALQGGPIVILLICMATVVLAVFLERWFFYRRESLNVAEFLRGILRLVSRKHYAEALDRCDEAHGPSVAVIRVALENHTLSQSELRPLLNEVASLQVPRFEKNLQLLANIALLAPLLGFLGTIIGMADVFQSIERAEGTATSAALSGGVWQALLSSAIGLIVCIGAISAHQFCLGHVKQFCDEMRLAAVELLVALQQKERVIESPSEENKSSTRAENLPYAPRKRKQ